MGFDSGASRKALEDQKNMVDQQKTLEQNQQQTEEEQSRDLLKRRIALMRQMQGGNGLDNSTTIG